LGNIGFLGFSGAADFQDMKPYFEEAYLWKTQRVSQAGSAEVISTHTKVQKELL
jgi:hypothetical protein